MSLVSLFGFGVRSTTTDELPNIYPFPTLEADFIRSDVINIYKRILTDTLERTQGIPEKQQPLLWDNCLASETQMGLVSLLAEAMYGKKDLFMVYDEATGVLRKAKQDEQNIIEKDYLKSGESSVGVFVTFKKYDRTDMVKLYSMLEYCTIASLYKQMNLSQAIQLKMNDLRAGVGLADSGDVKVQAQRMAEGLAAGRDILLDAKDVIETAKPDLTATQTAIHFINEKRSFYLGMPTTYLGSESGPSLGDTGEGDAKKVEQGLKGYFFSIIKPVIAALFGIQKLAFKSDDFKMVSSANETLKTFELTTNELISQMNKNIIINKLYGLPEDEVGDKPEPMPEDQQQIPGGNNVQGKAPATPQNNAPFGKS